MKTLIWVLGLAIASASVFVSASEEIETDCFLKLASELRIVNKIVRVDGFVPERVGVVSIPQHEVEELIPLFRVIHAQNFLSARRIIREIDEKIMLHPYTSDSVLYVAICRNIVAIFDPSGAEANDEAAACRGGSVWAAILRDVKSPDVIKRSEQCLFLSKFRRWLEGDVSRCGLLTGGLEQLMRAVEASCFDIVPGGIGSDESIMLYELAHRYFDGSDVAQHNAKALQFAEQAATLGSARAESLLAHMYYHGGSDIKQDPHAAFKYAGRAATKSNAEGQALFAQCYYYGQGVVQDYIEARKWAQRSSAQGNGLGFYLLACMHYYGHGVAVNYGDAHVMALASERQGYEDACELLGVLYYYGRGVVQNFATAVDYLKRAVAVKNSKAKALLARCYYYGNGVDPNDSEAFKAATDAANRDDVCGKALLAQCYYLGRGTAVDFVQARRWAERAAVKNNSLGKVVLARCCDRGEGGPKERTRAQEIMAAYRAQPDEDTQAFLEEVAMRSRWGCVIS